MFISRTNHALDHLPVSLTANGRRVRPPSNRMVPPLAETLVSIPAFFRHFNFPSNSARMGQLKSPPSPINALLMGKWGW
jgi:hypothetical protein